MSFRDNLFICLLNLRDVRVLLRDIIVSLRMKRMPEADYHAFMRLYSASDKTDELKSRFKRLSNYLDYRICKLANVIYGKEGTGRNKKAKQASSTEPAGETEEDDGAEDESNDSTNDSSFSISTRDLEFAGFSKRKGLLKIRVPLNSPNIKFVREAINEKFKDDLEKVIASKEK